MPWVTGGLWFRRGSAHTLYKLPVAPGSEPAVLQRVGAHVHHEGFIVVGFHVNRHLALDEFDCAVADADLVIEHRFATWDLKAWHDNADFAVTVLRHRSSLDG